MHIELTLNREHVPQWQHDRKLVSYYGSIYHSLMSWGSKHPNKGAYFTMRDDDTAIIRFDNERNLSWFLMTADLPPKFTCTVIENAY